MKSYVLQNKFQTEMKTLCAKVNSMKHTQIKQIYMQQK